MQRRNLVLILLGIIVVGCIIIILVLSPTNKYGTSNESEVLVDEVGKDITNLGTTSFGESTESEELVVEEESKYKFNSETSSYTNRLLTVGINLDKVPSIDRNLFYILNAKCGEVDNGLHDFTWTAFLESDGQFWGCGGSLISNRYVLTAAHCFSRRRTPSRVILGAYKLNSDKDCRFILGEEVCAPLPISIDIERIDVYPNYSLEDFYGDIALIRLAKPVKTKDLQTICLPKKSYVPDDETVFVAVGWGITENGMPSDVKLKFSLPFISKDRCSRLLKTIVLTDGQICAGGEKGKATCRGDSGGPLMVLDPDSKTYSIAGIISVSTCGISGAGVYTFIPKYLDWIFEKMKP